MKKEFFILAMTFTAATALTSCSNEGVTSDSFIGKWEAEYGLEMG